MIFRLTTIILAIAGATASHKYPIVCDYGYDTAKIHTLQARACCAKLFSRNIENHDNPPAVARINALCAKFHSFRRKIRPLRIRGGYDFSVIFETLKRKNSDGRSLADIFWDAFLNKFLVTKIVLFVNVFAYLVVQTGLLGPVHGFYCCPYDVVKNPATRFHLPFVSSFIHLSPSHLLSNMVFWSVIGQSLEQRYGALRMSITVCLAVLVVGIFEMSISLLLSAVSSLPNFLQVASHLLSRGGVPQSRIYQELLKQCSLETCHAGFSGVLFALSVVQVTSSCPMPSLPRQD